MTDREEARVDMFQEIDRFFIENKEKVSKDAILKKHSEQFHTNVLDIAQLMQEQEFDSKGYAQDKKEAKEALAEQMFKMGSAYCSYAVDNKNNVILEEFDQSNWDIKKLKDAEFVNYANRLIASLDENIKELKPYHITADELVNLTKQAQAYTDILHIPDEQIKNKAIATEKIKVVINDCYHLLIDSIDRDMVYYEEKDEPFYLEYKKRREIHDANSKHKSIIGVVNDADSDCDGVEDECPLAHVKCTVKFKAGHAWKEMHTTTSKKGNYQLTGIPDGKCTITFELDYYDTVTKDIAVYSDKATKLDIKMNKTIK